MINVSDIKEIIKEILSEMSQITKQGKVAMAVDKPLKTLKPDEIEGNIAFFRMGEGKFNIESRYLTPQERDWMIRNQLVEGFHDKAKLEAFFYRGSYSWSFWFFRNGQPAGEIQSIGFDGHMKGFGVQRSLQGTGLGTAMLKYAFEKTGLQQLNFGSEAHAFYHRIGGQRKTGSKEQFTLVRARLKHTPLVFNDIDKETALKYLNRGPVDPWPSRN